MKHLVNLIALFALVTAGACVGAPPAQPDLTLEQIELERPVELTGQGLEHQPHPEAPRDEFHDPDAPMELRWFNPSDPDFNWMISQGLLAFSPNDGLVHHPAPSFGGCPPSETDFCVPWTGPGLTRSHDGDLSFVGPGLAKHTVDASWLTRVESDLTGDVIARAVITHQELMRISPTPPDNQGGWEVHSGGVTITPQGDRAVAIQCFSRGEEQVAEMQAWDLGSASLTSRTTLPGPGDVCPEQPSWQGLRRFLVPTPDGERVLLVARNMMDGTVETRFILVRLADGALLDVQLAPAPDGIWGEGVISLAIHPHSDRVAFVTSDAKLHVWSLPDLLPLQDPESAHLVTLNPYSYMPQTASPLAWSPDGDVLASVGPEGHVQLRRLDEATPFATLVMPTTQDTEDAGLHHLDTGNPQWNPPAQVVFSRDGRAVAVHHQLGTAMWASPDWHPADNGYAPQVLLDGPESLATGEPGTFIATHLGIDVHSHQFFVNDVAVTAPTLGREMEWLSPKPGVFEVRVEIDDGVHVATATLTLEVHEVP